MRTQYHPPQVCSETSSPGFDILEHVKAIILSIPSTREGA